MIKHHNGHGAGGNGDADNYEHSYGGNDDALKLAITLPSQTVPCLIFEDAEWEDLCRENGAWEYIDGTISPATAGKRNEFGGELIFYAPIMNSVGVETEEDL